MEFGMVLAEMVEPAEPEVLEEVAEMVEVAEPAEADMGAAGVLRACIGITFFSRF